MNIKRIAVTGCGWLGLPLAARLAEQVHFVRGSTTQKEKIPLLEEEGIEPWLVRLNPAPEGDNIHAFFEVDTVVLAFPPPRTENKTSFMEQQARELIQALNSSGVSRLIMASSTGVYGFHQQDADEQDPHPPQTENGKGLKMMEELFLADAKASTAVVRLAGLIGPGRNPGRFLSGRSTGGNGNEPVNLIHQTDAIGVIEALIMQPDLTGIFNACAAEHPSRTLFYSTAARRFGYPEPIFAESEPKPWKRIISDRIRKEAGYSFVYDNPIDALEDM
ncbi:SDR family oxidoreductase [Balneolaceae bacterium ANBcel3]|nr:SDR family oxidoreductase [Balneolaceae bacterium ANBcel3]